MAIQVELKPGIGMGNLMFGASRDDVRQLLGEPAQEEVFDNGDVHWWYSSLQTSIYFGYDNSLRVDLIEARHTNARLWGVVIIGLELTEMLQLFEKHGCAPPEISEGSGGEFLYDYDECGCNVYVEAGVVTSIQLSVLFDEAGDHVQWPSDAIE